MGGTVGNRDPPFLDSEETGEVAREALPQRAHPKGNAQRERTRNPEHRQLEAS